MRCFVDPVTEKHSSWFMLLGLSTISFTSVMS